MINSFKLFKPDKLSDQKCFQYGNDIPSGLVLSFHQFVKHYKGLDHLEKSFELDLQQLVFCSRKSFDSFVFKENSFSLSSYGHKLITGILFASSYALDDFMVSTLLEHNSHKAETDFCGDFVLKPVHSYSESDLELKLLCSESDQVRHVLEMFYEKLVHVLRLFFRNYTITYLETLLGKQVQPQKSESIDRAHQPEI
ncbi:hypothetical protein F2Q70_00016745 [Brassica cretica]|uniref:Uncharacterized protein n=1 Tax=Brassica cretica TaxID=69181 RepID=A0A8S9I498_BRACR|nr:hypothetical protein F2Q70_00016745 [Brassica cretica]